jgi:hypothetical protein
LHHFGFDYEHSLETDERNQPAGWGEVENGLSSPTERERSEPRRVPHSSLEYSNRASVTLRKRSSHYYLAKAALSRVADCGREKLDLLPVVVHFDNWMYHYSMGRYIRLTKENDWLFIRCVNRFMPEYKRMLWKKMKFLQSIEWDLKIELTLDPKKFMRLEDELIFIDKAWSKLRSWLLKRYGHFEFLKVLEVQKSGRPHLHVLIQGVSYVPHEDLAEIWHKYGGGYVWIRSLGKGVNAVWYVLKYVNKTILNEERVYAALLFASNKRMFSMSQKLMVMLDVKRDRKEQGWTFQGTVEESIVMDFCREENMIKNDIIKIDATIDRLHEYPLLFDFWDGG